MGLIYKATNTVNGKSYIGQTRKSLARRRKEHETESRRNQTTVFHRALRKYGFDAFVWEVILDGIDDEDLNVEEFIAIRKHKTQVPLGYNLLSGGGGLGQHSQVTKDKISAGNKGKKRSDAFKRRVSEVHTGRKDSPETTERRQKALRGKKRTAEMKQKLRELRLGKTYEEIMGVDKAAVTKAKQSTALKYRDPEIRKAAAAKSSLTQKGRKLSEAHKKALSEAAKKRKPMSEETRRKLSESVKRAIRKQKEADAVSTPA